MLKKLFFVVLCSSLVYGEKIDQNFEILASKIKSSNNKLYAENKVVVFSKNYYITSDKAIYDRESGYFELFGNVVVIKDDKLELFSDYAKIELNSENSLLKPSLLLDTDSNIWINSTQNKKSKTRLELKDSLLSSCDCEDPAWSIRFSEGSYDQKEKWVHTYNTRLYIKSLPVFYAPYFGFPTDRTRRTGILRPTLGYSKSEGFIYEQPIYIAPKDNYDVELVPQTRLKRGNGLYVYYRYADSKYSLLKLKTGFFKEKQNYKKEYNLKNEKHYGYNINYKRKNLFSNDTLESKDGLFVDIEWLNDVEYKNLETSKRKSDYTKTIESKVNYIYNTPKYYAGAYFRYYLDSSKDSNDETLQQLPQLHGHSYINELFSNINYSTDIKYTNFYRPTGLNTQKYDIRIPVFFTKSLFDDYVTLTLKEEFRLINMNYSQGAKKFEDATLLENRHVIALSTDLIKPYKDYLHTINFNTEFSIPNSVKKDGDIYGVTSNDSDLSSFGVDELEKTLAFSLNHSLYDKKSLKQIINHKIKQSIFFDTYSDSKLSDLENDLTLNLPYTNIKNKLIYSNEDKEVIESSSSIKFDRDNYYFKVSHYSSKKTANSNREDLESYTLNTGVKFLKDYEFSYEENYNLKLDTRNKQSFKFTIDDRCWSINLKYEKELVATSSLDAEAIQQDIVYLNFVLKPIGGFNQKYKIKDAEQN